MKEDKINIEKNKKKDKKKELGSQGLQKPKQTKPYLINKANYRKSILSRLTNKVVFNELRQ